MSPDEANLDFQSGSDAWDSGIATQSCSEGIRRRWSESDYLSQFISPMYYSGYQVLSSCICAGSISRTTFILSGWSTIADGNNWRMHPSRHAIYESYSWIFYARYARTIERSIVCGGWLPILHQYLIPSRLYRNCDTSWLFSTLTFNQYLLTKFKYCLVTMMIFRNI